MKNLEYYIEMMYVYDEDFGTELIHPDCIKCLGDILGMDYIPCDMCRKFWSSEMNDNSKVLIDAIVGK